MEGGGQAARGDEAQDHGGTLLGSLSNEDASPKLPPDEQRTQRLGASFVAKTGEEGQEDDGGGSPLAVSLSENVHRLRAAFKRQLLLTEYRFTNWSFRAQTWTKESREWLEEQLRDSRACVAVMLPGTDGPIALAAQSGVRHPTRAIRTCAVADTSFCGSPRRLWLVELDSDVQGEPVQAQLRFLRQTVEFATQAHKLEQGPWMWPLHNNGVSLALLSANVALVDAAIPTWRRFLWYLRMLPLPTGCKGEGLLARHYGSAVSYAFAWSNLYVQGLWVLVLIAVLSNVALKAGPTDPGNRRFIPWVFLQFLTLLWARLLADKAHSRHKVLESGGVEAKPEKPADPSRPAPAPASQQSSGSGGSFSRQALQSDREEAVRRDACRAQRQAQAAQADDGSKQLVRARWQKAMAAARLSARKVVLEAEYNWNYQPVTPAAERRRKLLTPVVTFLAISLFSVVCMWVLASFVQLNTYLIYVWGGCLDPDLRREAAAVGDDCRSPQFRYPLAGWFAEVGSDIGLAILFDVGLGAASKALAEVLVSYRNYKFEKDRQYHKLMISMLVEGLSKVGMYAIIGFAFLPQWVKHEHDFTAAERCANLIDYNMCTAIMQCDTVLDPDCCSGALMCIAQHLDFDDRRDLFEKSVKGPFIVSPFVRILVTVIIPWVSGWLEQLVTTDARDDLSAEQPPRTAQGARVHGFVSCLRAAVTPIVRILALIFHLDGDNTGGCGYLCRGWPFGRLHRVGATDAAAAAEGLLGRVEEGGQSTEAADAEEVLLRRSLDQVARKPFEPLDELLDIKMNFLFVAMFAPIMPIGLVPTLIARLIEVRFKATKLLFVRRRCWPGASSVLHMTQDLFAHAVVVIAAIWHTGLLLVSYNPAVGDWPLVVTLGSWLAAAAVSSAFVYALSRLFHLAQKSCRSPGEVAPPNSQASAEGRASDAGIELVSTSDYVEVTV